MSDLFRAMSGMLKQRAAWSDFTPEPYIARIEDGASLNRGVGINISTDQAAGERRFRGGSSTLNRADVSVAISTQQYLETEALVEDLSKIQYDWGRPQLWSSTPIPNRDVGDPPDVALLVLSYRIGSIDRSKTAEHYYRATVPIELTYRRR